MTVYILVENYDYEGDYVEGVFSTFELAKAAAGEPSIISRYRIYESEVDTTRKRDGFDFEHDLLQQPKVARRP